MEGVLGVRKGAWTKEEDVLLSRCIAIYGEGKWHLISLRSGLNRCRKSYRLRWLNYLKPSIKRGKFEEDEVDLMIKLHKILGNRWSLIAGRLHGRTANDVKNYWNTHLRKKEESSRERETSKCTQSLSRHEVIRPQPWTFSKGVILKCQKARLQELDQRKEKPTISYPFPPQAVAGIPCSPKNEKEWWETALAGVIEDGGEGMNRNEMISVGESSVLEQPLKTSDEENGWNWWREMEFDAGFDLL